MQKTIPAEHGPRNFLCGWLLLVIRERLISW
jgi:hypothetical protein